MLLIGSTIVTIQSCGTAILSSSVSKIHGDNITSIDFSISVDGFSVKKIDLLIEPHTRYMLKPINNSSYPLQQKIFVYGLNVGLRLKL